jgi:CMP-N,N'-diacetyllegionaminic acid synthase
LGGGPILIVRAQIMGRSSVIDGKRILAVVPARGGSKGLPGKNIKLLAGRPLIAWSLEAGQRSQHVDRTILSTDDLAIMEVAGQLGADVPFMRPEELAQDETPGTAPVLHAVRECPGFDLVVVLQPTSPLRTAAHVDAAIELMVARGADRCVSVTKAVDHPFWTYTRDSSGRLVPFIDTADGVGTRRQDLPEAWVLNGAIYITRVTILNSSGSLAGADCVAYPMSEEDSVDIDDLEDFQAAEARLGQVDQARPSR